MDLKSVINYKLILLLILFGIVPKVDAQIKSERFDPSLVPLGFELVNAFGSDVLISLPIEKLLWSIQRKSSENEVKWSGNLSLEENENIFYSKIVDDKLIFFSTKFLLNEQKSELYKIDLDLNSGKVIERKLLWTKEIGQISRSRNKAKRIADASLELASLKSNDTEVPLKYRFEVKTSINSLFTLISFFDYSQKNLMHSYQVLDDQFKLIESKDLKIDELVSLYDYGIDASGSIYHLNQSFNGDMQLIRFPLGLDKYELLKLTAENSQRDDLSLLELEPGRMVVVGKSEIDESFYGCIYAVFDFNNMEIDRVHFESLPIEFKDVADSLYKIGKLEVTDWRNYTLTQVSSFNDEELLIAFEAFDLRRSGYVFRDIRFSTELDWTNHKAKLISGPAMIFSFDKNDELRWSKYIYKKVEMGTKFPSSSNFYSTKPKNESISFFINKEDGLMQYEMDYIYDSWHKSKIISNQRLISVVQNDKKENYLILFSEEDSSLTIQKK